MGLGFCTISAVTLESAQYVAKYCMKKIIPNEKSPQKIIDHYQHITRYGELVELTPEFSTMSRRPGIGSTWYERFQGDCYPSNFLIVNGIKMAIPKYYNQFLELSDPKLYKTLKWENKRQAKKSKDNTSERLKVRETIVQAKLNQSKRNYES